LEAKENEKRGEFVGEFNVGEKEIDKESIDKNIKDREERLEPMRVIREGIDDTIEEFKSGSKDRDKTLDNLRKTGKIEFDGLNESAEQIKKDKK